MGILNVTPDSFSDGGRFTSRDSITHQIEQMISGGADIIDIGGESTRPFAVPVSEKEEINRVIPAIKVVRSISDIPISIDTTKSGVAREAIAVGANIINDISALTIDKQMLEVALSYQGPLIIMHMQGTPDTMQIRPHYENIIDDILSFFSERIQWLSKNGIHKKRIIIDPGIGFGKTLEHNLIILQNIEAIKQIGCPVLIGHSRKSFLDKLFHLDITQRDCPTAVISALCALKGTDIIRVHDVALSKQAIQLAAILMD